jgi:uncharacterized protein involved in exopolysaccharide biosynthesis
MTETVAGEPHREPLVDFAPLLRTLWQRRVWIAGCVVLALGLAAAYLAVTRPMYSAQAVVLVDPRKPQTTDTDNVLPGIGSDSAAIASQVAVISSRELLMTVFEREGLVDDPEFSAPDPVGQFFGASPGRAMIFDRFAENVWVEREGLTYVIDIGFESRDPDKAARIVNAIVREYIAGQVAQKAAANAEVSSLLDDRIAELQQDVIDAERAAEEFRAAHAIYNSGNGATQLQAQIDELERQLVAAEETAREAATRAEQAIAAGVSPAALLSLSKVLASPTAEALRTEYNQRSVELSSQQSVLGPRHPTLRRLQSEVERVEGLMVKEVARITDELVSGRDIAQGVVAAIRSDLARFRAEGNEDNLRQIELRQLERNADASRQVLEEFQKRAAETSQFESLQFSDARVVTNATAPLRPVWPKTGLILIVATILGFVAGCSAALFAGPRKAAARPALSKPAAAVIEPRPRHAPFLPLLLSHLRPPQRAAAAARPPAKPAPKAAAKPPANGKPNGHANGAFAPNKAPSRPPARALTGRTSPAAASAVQSRPTSPPPAGTTKRPLVNGKAVTAQAAPTRKPAPPAAPRPAERAPMLDGAAKPAGVSSPRPVEGPSAAAIEAAVKEVKRRRGFADLN